MNHNSRLALLHKAINRWLELPKVSRQTLSNSVFDEAFSQGVADTLHANGLSFVNPSASDDPSDVMRTNSQALFRWLGYHPDACKPQPQHLFHIEPVILSVMPSRLKTSYLNAVYAKSGVYICDAGDSKLDDTVLTPSDSADLTRENSEAQIAIISLPHEATKEQLEVALNELSESKAKTSQVQTKVRERINNIKAVQPTCV